MNPQALTPTIAAALSGPPAPDATPSGLRPAPGRVEPLPEYFSTTDRDALPERLYWAGETTRPPINGRVDVIRFGIYLGCGTVSGYFHRGNVELGVLVALDNVAEHLDLIEGTTKTHFYGENIRRLDQGDEPVEEQDEQNAPGEQNAPTGEAEQLLPLAVLPEPMPEPMPELQRLPRTAPTKDAGTEFFNLDSQ